MKLLKFFTILYYGILVYWKKMPKIFQPVNYEREVLKKIRAAEIALRVTPHGSVKEVAVKELEKLHKELEEIRNPK
jgi:hypothetical protein